MKKVTLLFAKRLSEVIKTDEEWRGLPLLKYGLALVNYVVEMGATYHPFNIPKPTFPIVCPTSMSQGLLTPFPESPDLATVARHYQRAGRIEAQLYVGTIDVVLGVDISFFPKGKGEPILVLRGGVDSMGARLLEITKATC
jgi:hypothetical protein